MMKKKVLNICLIFLLVFAAIPSYAASGVDEPKNYNEINQLLDNMIEAGIEPAGKAVVTLEGTNEKVLVDYYELSNTFLKNP